ncbi:COX15-CtaA-domain-containing protein [Mytilinidion resinicola]|uniref:COX15-CtaA-domain-containing protein n=1 Tax=Mytilinidion resinicola TaxID=574789 RepID=A0A6A6Y0B8_9PEZI|nr:COX15-CtaA-domain-containing protein [Mytilinidion resinicola]KAF2802266.1 COX15-CtaA-domain-containing protein [Mytilinidion resinicola]
MASIFTTFPLLRQAAPRLTREFFTCRACVKTPLPSAIRPSLRKSPFAQVLRSQSTQTHRPTTSDQSPLGTLSGTIGGRADAKATPKTSSFPETSDKAVAYWLLGSAASVFGIVILGGLTRLTESGLSITEWRPVTGSIPPMTPEDWEIEFTKYRSSPEFALLNPNMTLPEFKQIFWMEWGHRLWGRVIGLTFVVPTIYFIAQRKVSVPMAWKLIGISGLIGFQGVIGWWMVKSGLHDDLFAKGSHPRVSQYRLTTHLGAAFIVYTTMLLSGLSILRERSLLKDPEAAQKLFATLKNPNLRLFRGSVTALSVLVFVTAMSGALVAGLDAGLIYNEFPYMGLGLTPPKKELFDPFYSHVPDQSDIWWRNMLENPSLVQLDHRILAMTTFTAIMSLFAYTRYSSRVRPILPANARKGVMGSVHLVCMQVALGISTLIYMVPTWLAATHQAGSLALLTGVLVLGSRVSMSRRAVRLVQQAAKQQSAALRGSGKRRLDVGVKGVEQKRP